MKTTFVATLASLGLMAGAAHAATVSLNPTADGDVQVFGGDDVDTVDDTLNVTQSGGLQRNAIFEYDLSSIADTATINSATFSFTITRFISNVGANPVDIELYAYLGDSVVDIADFDAPATQVVSSTAPAGGVAGDMFSFVLSTVAPIQSALAGDNLTLRFETNSFAGIQLASLENANFGPASLSIDFTPLAPIPLPAGLPLLLAGLGGLAVMRRRKG